MKFDVVFNHEDRNRAERAQPSPKMTAMAFYEGVFGALVFHDSVFKPLMKGLIARNPREECLIALHYRLVAFLLSTRQVSGPVHFQTLQSMARSVFEIGVDIALMLKDPTNDSAAKLHAFNKWETFRLSEECISYYDGPPAVPVPGDYDLSMDRGRIAAEAAEVAASQTTYRFRNPAAGWYGKKVRDRAKDAGAHWLDRYFQFYGKSSWSVHGGLANSRNVNEDVAYASSALAFRMIADVAVDSWEGIGNALQLGPAVGDFAAKIDFLRHFVVWGRLTDLRLHSLGEPLRFSFLDAQETARWFQEARFADPPDVF